VRKLVTGARHRCGICRRVKTMSEFLTAVAVAVLAALLERVAVRLARSLWSSVQPAA
jgi:hypothetical protein